MASNTTSNKSEMRKDVIGKDDYYMGVAVLSSFRSKDPVTQVGACIVNEDDRIVGIGYNGMPNKTKDEEMPWGKDGEKQLEKKHLYVCHAEMNAIANKYAADLKNCRMYVNHYPCNECAKIIVQARITEVIYDKVLPPKKAERPMYEATKRIFKETGIKCRLHIPKQVTTIIKSESNVPENCGEPSSVKRKKINEEKIGF